MQLSTFLENSFEHGLFWHTYFDPKYGENLIQKQSLGQNRANFDFEKRVRY